MRMDNLAATLLEEAKRLGHKVPPVGKVNDLMIFAIRNTSKTVGLWDDCIGALRWERDGTLALRAWQGTTDPGREGAGGKLHSGGVAVVEPGFYSLCWTIGVHKAGTSSEHQALVQRTPGVFVVRRDRVIDGKRDVLGPQVRDAAGINLHRAWRDELERVGDASHGCQVIRNKTDHDELMRLCREQVAFGMGSKFSHRLYDLDSSPTLQPILTRVLNG